MKKTPVILLSLTSLNYLEIVNLVFFLTLFSSLNYFIIVNLVFFTHLSGLDYLSIVNLVFFMTHLSCLESINFKFGFPHTFDFLKIFKPKEGFCDREYCCKFMLTHLSGLDYSSISNLFFFMTHSIFDFLKNIQT